MQRTVAVAVLAALTAAGCATAPAPADAPATAPTQPAAPPPPNANAIPAGTVLTVRLAQELNTTTTRSGDIFTVTVQEPLVATNNQTVIAEGSVITGMVTGVGATGEGQAAIRVNFLRISLDGVSHPLSARVLDTAPPEGTLPTASREEATETEAGAVLGVVVGGDLRTALVGGFLGAGAGTIVSLGRGDVEPVLPERTLLRIQTRDRIDLRL
jgi:hypothetical protein